MFLLSHCLLNDLAKVEAFDNSNSFLVIELLRKGNNIIQLPCPEFTYLGGKRWGMVKEQYDTIAFRKHCRKILIPIFEELVDYMAVGVNTFYYLGIKGSPSCGVYYTCSNDSFKGEVEGKIFKETKLIEESGVFVEEFNRLAEEFKIDIIMLEVDENNIDDIIKKIRNIEK